MVSWEQKGAEAVDFFWQIWHLDEPCKIPGFGYFLKRCRPAKGQINTPFGEQQPVMLVSAANTFWSRVRVHETGSLIKVHTMPDGDEFRELLKRA